MYGLIGSSMDAWIWNQSAKTSLEVVTCRASPRRRRITWLSLTWQCKHEKQNAWTFSSISGYHHKLLEEVSVVSTPLCPADPECPTIQIPNRSSLLPGVHSTFSSLTQIFRSGSNCTFTCLVIAKSWNCWISMRDGQTTSFWRGGLGSLLGTEIRAWSTCVDGMSPAGQNICPYICLSWYVLDCESERTELHSPAVQMVDSVPLQVVVIRSWIGNVNEVSMITEVVKLLSRP
jgi:hypothetical protein